jgi:hypothetical protein
MSEGPQETRNRRLAHRRRPKIRIKVTCRKGGLDLGANLAVALLDVSESGARILVKEAMPINQEASVSLESPSHTRPVFRLGNVIWSVPAAEGGHCVGINFHKYLTYKDLLFFANL